MRGEQTKITKFKQSGTIIVDQHGQIIARIKIGRIVKLVIAGFSVMLLALIFLGFWVFLNNLKIDKLEIEVQKNGNTSNDKP